MGDARRKKLQAASRATALSAAAQQVSAALRKLASASSGHLGSDCYVHAALGNRLLADLAIETKPVVGFAAWRVGNGDGDVISHTPRTQGHLPAGGRGFAYHAWLDCSGFIIDFTTYQLSQKALTLDAADGGHTEVRWCPDFLLLSPQEIRSYEQVAAALHPGVAYYEANPELEPLLRSGFELDAADLQHARLILQNPHVNVFGPNSLEHAHEYP